jgi:hypothetical protein
MLSPSDEPGAGSQCHRVAATLLLGAVQQRLDLPQPEALLVIEGGVEQVAGCRYR